MRPLCLILGAVLLLGPSHNNAVVNKVGNKVNGLFLSISLDTLVSVTEVIGDKVTTKNVGNLDDRQRMRPPCVSCPHGYNSLWANVTNQLIVPDVNALQIVNEDGTYVKTVTLTNCDPYSMHTLLHDHTILWVLCNPVGNKTQVYRVSLMNLSTETPLDVYTTSGLFLPKVGVIFERGGVLHVILATANELVFASQDTPGVQPLDWNKRCLSVLRLTDFNDLLLKKILIECGNSTSQTVENTYLCDYNFECSDVLLPPRTLGKIITSDDVSILASVAPNRIDILEWNQGRVSQVVPSPNHKFHDAYIERVAGSHLMVYSDKGGKVHLYNVSAALNGDDVSSQTIEGDYVTCEDCSGLVMIGEGYFVTATDSEGVAWFSTTPPELLRTSRGIKADRLAYSSSQFPTVVIDTVTESPKTNPMMVGIVGGVVALIVVVVLSTVAVVIVLYLFRRWRIRHKTGRTHGESVIWVQQEGVILNNGQPTQPANRQPTDQIVTPKEETPITPKNSTQESLSDSEDLHGKLVPGVSETPFMHEFTNKPTRIGQLFKEADSLD